MVALTDRQLEIVMTAAGVLAPEMRSLFLERVGAMLRGRGPFTDDDVNDVVWLAVAVAHEAA